MILADASLTPTDLTGALTIAVGALCTVVGVLFWQLIASKSETLALAKELIPVSTALLQAAQAFQKIVERREGQQP